MKFTEEATRHTVRGRALECPVCRGVSFLTRHYLLNTRGATLFNFDWADRSATTYVCSECGHILWFAKDPEGQS